MKRNRRCGFLSWEKEKPDHEICHHPVFYGADDGNRTRVFSLGS